MSTERRIRIRRKIEREFGVPIAGEILEAEHWTSTALKELPFELLEWGEIFGRHAPIVLDLGCGNGRFLIGSAVWRPDRDHLGVDVLPLVVRYATRRANQRGLSNVRFAACGGRELLDRVRPGSVDEIHCYHPQPFYDEAEIGQRLITPAFLARVHASLVPGGMFVIQTDHPAYWKYMQEVVPAFFEFEQREECWPDAPKGRTRREIIALRRGLSVFRGTGFRRDVSAEAVQSLVGSLPLPLFDADRSLCDLDALESEQREPFSEP